MENVLKKKSNGEYRNQNRPLFYMREVIRRYAKKEIGHEKAQEDIYRIQKDVPEENRKGNEEEQRGREEIP